MDGKHHYFSMRQPDNSEHVWHVPRLWRRAQDISAQSISLTGLIRKISPIISNYTSDDWARVKEADMCYPIIISKDFEDILDGCHRCVKAAMLGWTHINAVFMELPPACYYSDEWTDWESKIEELMGVKP